MKKVVRTKIGGYRGFHSMTLQFLSFAVDMNKDERLVLDLSDNMNAYQDDINDKNTWNQWFIQEDWSEEDVTRDVGSVEHGSSIGGWISDKSRLMYNSVMKKHLVVQDHILKKIEDFKLSYFQGNKVLGVHIRGTDTFNDDTRPKLSFNYYKHKIDLYLEKEKFDKIFVCSDQIHTIERLKSIYGDKLINYPILPYSSEGHAYHYHNKKMENEGYIRAEEILIESILLAQTNFLLRAQSGVTVYSLIYNPELEFCDIDIPFFNIKKYLAEPPDYVHKCKYEDNFDVYYEEIKQFTEKLPTIEGKDRVNFIQSYL